MPGARKKGGVAFYGLLCVCLAVWGYVFVRLARGILQGERPGEAVITAAAPIPREVPAPAPDPDRAFDAGFRNPFAWPDALFAVPPASPRAPPRPPASSVPALVLAGIVGETALLQGADGSIHIARAGDDVGAARLLRVHSDHVVVRYAGRSFSLHLGR